MQSLKKPSLKKRRRLSFKLIVFVVVFLRFFDYEDFFDSQAGSLDCLFFVIILPKIDIEFEEILYYNIHC